MHPVAKGSSGRRSRRRYKIVLAAEFFIVAPVLDSFSFVVLSLVANLFVSPGD
jgi:hypothetical protein